MTKTKKTIRRFTLIVSVFAAFILCFQAFAAAEATAAAAAARRYVLPGGELVGIRLRTVGVTVAGVTPFDTDGGTVSPADEAGFRIGDVIRSVDGAPVNTCEALTRRIEQSGGRPLTAEVERDGKALTLTLTPKKTAHTGLYRGGLWVRDSAAGVGTLTFSDPVTGRIATLGHGICDADTSAPVAVSDGGIYTATLTGVIRGTPGCAGELGGHIGETLLGSVDENSDRGVYGDLYLAENTDGAVPVATRSEVTTGAAQVLCTVTAGEKQAYDIEIVRLKAGPGGDSMTVRVTDAALLAETGGIVQGMSGSPILQNGRLVGAVTHVFVNDPRAGYAIYAEDMLD